MKTMLRYAIVSALLCSCAAPLVASPRGDRSGAERPGADRGEALDANRHADAWQALRGIVSRDTLGPDGGRDGDLWPTIGEAASTPDRPWVVWSRFNGVDYDLAYTRWIERAWLPTRWVQGGASVDETANLGDDFDPALAFDRTGRPIMAWWRDEGGRGRVYFSIFLESRWLDGFVVSGVGVDARHPSIEMISADTVRIGFDAPAGRIRHTIRFLPPVTITDDLNPLDFRFRTDRIEFIKQND